MFDIYWFSCQNGRRYTMSNMNRESAIRFIAYLGDVSFVQSIEVYDSATYSRVWSFS